MKLKIVLTAVIILRANFCYAQNSCGCGEALGKLISKIESEYPGFRDKTKDKIVYESLVNQVKEEAKNTMSSPCFSVLKKYTSFFRDPHIWLINNKAQATELKPNEVFKVEIDKFQKSIVKTKNQAEGIWKDETYEIGIKKNNNNEYIGFIINSKSTFWKPKEIKFKLFTDGTCEYYMQDHSQKKTTYKILEKSILSFDSLETSFVRQTPQSLISKEEIIEKIGELNNFYLRSLTPKTTIIKLPKFGYEHVEMIENLIEKNKTLLENSENLIVDLRDNGGGTDISYYKLLPYIMTNNIRSLGVEYLSTPTLISGLQSYISTIKDKEAKQEEIERIEKEINILKENKGKFVNLNDKTVSIWEVKAAKKSPKNVVILTNNKVGSSAENLVMNAKQSKKVKIIGTPTYGGLDYASGRYFDFGCPEYQLLLPTFRSLRLPDYPIDNIGIQPDIYLDKTETDWIKYAIEYLEN
jgi:hypothetical protein